MNVYVYMYIWGQRLMELRKNKMWVYGRVGKKEIETENYAAMLTQKI